MGDNKDSNGVSIYELEDVIHKFLIIMLEHSVQQKDGWKASDYDLLCFSLEINFIHPSRNIRLTCFSRFIFDQ
jgi:hypothetical protein